MKTDLHCHSTASDGALTPEQLVLRAHRNGVVRLALTDHDQLTGLPMAAATAESLGMAFINGVEISVSWHHLTVHIVGLNFDSSHPALIQGLAEMAKSRQVRALEMARQLEEVGVICAYEGALAQAHGRADLLSRTHFARYLVAQKKSANVRAVFMDYLVDGKPGFVEHQWSTLEQAVGWITQAGGVAVIAHPGRYAHDESSEIALIQEFIDCGGQGIEVITGSHSKKQFRTYAEKALHYGLYASCGSDFHALNESKMDVGKVPMLSTFNPLLKPVWEIWQ